MKRSIDIETLVKWTFCDELVKGGSEAFSPSWERMNRFADLGTLIDESHFERLPAIFGDPHPDAILVARYVDKLPHRSAVQVMIHAWAGDRPKPFSGTPRILPIRDGSRVKLFGGKSYGRSANGWRYYTEGSHCMLRFDPSLEEIDASRDEWRLWRAGLVALVQWLWRDGVLQEHIPTGPNVPMAPWSH
jgi:hypothetical protein